MSKNWSIIIGIPIHSLNHLIFSNRILYNSKISVYLANLWLSYLMQNSLSSNAINTQLFFWVSGESLHAIKYTQSASNRTKKLHDVNTETGRSSTAIWPTSKSAIKYKIKKPPRGKHKMFNQCLSIARYKFHLWILCKKWNLGKCCKSSMNEDVCSTW